MKTFKNRLFITTSAFLLAWGIGQRALSADFVVYSVDRAIDLGDGESPRKDYYVNLGADSGAAVGAILEVARRTPTYDLAASKLYKESTFIIAQLRVIHAEGGISIARLEKMLPSDKIPSIQPHTVMVGDLVRLKQ